jgi:hypothetical protein
MTLFSAYNQELQKMNDVIGYNTAVDGSSPDTKALVGVNKMAVSATNNALRPLYQHSIDLITRQARRLALMIQDSISLNNEAFIQSIGAWSTETIEYGKKIAFNQFAINIELLPDEEEKMQIEQLIQLGIKSGTITVSDAIRIRQVLKEDVKLGAQLMVLLEEKNRKNRMEEQKALTEQNGQVQIQSGQAVAQANAEAEMQISDSKGKLLKLEYSLKAKLSAQEHQQVMEQIGGKNQGAEVVAVVNSHAKENVQETINEGKKEVAEMTHHGKILETAFEKAIEPKEPKKEK